jgi:ribonuclease J
MTKSHHNTAPLELLPLGGLGAIGMNCMLLGHAGRWVMLDCGATFPSFAEAPGADTQIPSLDAIAELGDKIEAIVITHGHEDHIGALPWVLGDLDVPVWAPRFAAALIEEKLGEFEFDTEPIIHTVMPGDREQIGPFGFHWIQVSHSIPDACSLAIDTPHGKVLFTGDFKIEPGELPDGTAHDEAAFRALGDEGVFLMMSDSTNAEVPGWSRSEAVVAEKLVEVVGRCEGRVLVGLFSSNLYRVHAVLEAAARAGRKVALAGRSLNRYVRLASSASDLPIDRDRIVPLDRIDDVPDRELLIVATGSQGESRAALPRMARGQHRQLRVKEGDSLILSARKIPGNEALIIEMLQDFARRGATVVQQIAEPEIHASGHAYSDELRAMIQWVRPERFVPVHGVYTFMRRHAEIAREEGVRHTLIIENGQRVQAGPDGLRVAGEVSHEPWYTEGGLVAASADALGVRERLDLAHNGMIAISAWARRARRGLVGYVRVQVRGIYDEEGELTALLERRLQEALEETAADTPRSGIESRLRNAARRFFRRHLGRKPLTVVFAHVAGEDD